MKNNRIQFWRIVMTYVIAVYHFNKRYGVYTSGYIAVEFFFMVSGYLLADKYYRTKGSDNSEQLSAIRYVWGRYRKYWPHSAVAFFTAFLAVGVYRGYAIGDYLMGLATHLPELFLVNMLGFRTGGGISYNDITWFLSSLLIVSFLIWLFMKWNDRLYVGIVVPISVVLIYVSVCKVWDAGRSRTVCLSVCRRGSSQRACRYEYGDSGVSHIRKNSA